MASLRLKPNLAKSQKATSEPIVTEFSAQRHVPTELTERSPQVIPAKATLDRKVHNFQPAVLVYWQETYDDGYGHLVQRTFWRVVVLENPTPKEQPQKNI